MDSKILDINFRLKLDRFTLQVDLRFDRHVTGIFGPSGCGKTSLLEVLAGLRTSAQGVVRLGDTTWQDTTRGILQKPEQRGIGYVPQSGLLFPHKSVRENLLFGAQRVGREGKPSSAHIFDSVVELLELAPLLERRTHKLSGGERQRVALGRALCSAPKLLLLDEPLAALDQGLRYRILPFLRRIRDEFELPMILVSHDPVEVQALCDDVVVLRRGQVVARGAPREVLLDPAVFALADERGFENIIPCRTVSSHDAETVVALGAAGSNVTLSLPNLRGQPARAQFVGIPARDILVSTRKPEGLSARNILPATIQDAHVLGGLVLLKVTLGPEIEPLAVEVSKGAWKELDLGPGKGVYLIVKSMSCKLFEDRHTPELQAPAPATESA
jgi:molybdate transport system ATP-binding protein